MIVRQAVSSPAAEGDLATLAAGVRAMSKLAHGNPLSWEYQSRMHGKPDGLDPAPGEPADFSQCQHGTWWFLPWHRMYLRQFERIVAHVTETPDFALPYWDYRSPAEAVIPRAFTVEGSALHNETRDFRPVMGNPRPWLRTQSFTLFGGVDERSHVHHGPMPGFLESYPHNTVHGIVGGDMAGFQSPLDPLFWIHHCNIDRLWEVWRTQPGHANPTSDAWLTSEFEFPDPERGRRKFKVAEVDTTESAGYRYDNLEIEVQQRELVSADLLFGPGLDDADNELELEEWFTMTDPPGPGLTDDGLELVGATSASQNVRDQVEFVPETTAAIGLEQVDGVNAIQAFEPPTLLLRLENVGIDAGDATDMWDVFVAVGDRRRHHVGTIVPFGLAGLTRGGGRQTLTFDVSDLAVDISGAPGDPLRVTFEPTHGDVVNEPYWERAALYRAGS